MAFKAITVNTPAADPAHILAEDDAALYESLVGGDKVLNVGGKLAATTISNNKIRITDGVVIVGGHVGRIYKGDYEDLTIENGTSGQNRNDLIVARYLAGNSGGADSYGLAVIKGTPGSTATDPIYMQGNLYNGDPQRDFPLYRAKLEGLSIVAVEQLFEVGKTIGELEEEIETLNSNKSNVLMKKSKGISVTIKANGNVNSSVDISEEGYTAVGIIGVAPNAYGVVPESWSVIQDTQVLYYRARNDNSRQVTLTLWYEILYIKVTS